MRGYEWKRDAHERPLATNTSPSLFVSLLHYIPYDLFELRCWQRLLPPIPWNPDHKRIKAGTNLSTVVQKWENFPNQRDARDLQVSSSSFLARLIPYISSPPPLISAADFFSKTLMVTGPRTKRARFFLQRNRVSACTFSLYLLIIFPITRTITIDSHS